MNNTWHNPPPSEATLFGGPAAYVGPVTHTTDMPGKPRPRPLDRHHAVRIATAGIADRASRSDDLSYADLGDAAVTALVDLGVLDVVDLDAVSEEQRRRDAHSVLDRDQAEVERDRQDGAA